MSRAIASFFILIVSIQQIFTDEEFQNLVLERLEKLESENVRLGSKVEDLGKKLEQYKLVSFQSKYELQIVQDALQECKQKTNQHGEDLIKLDSNVNHLQDVTLSLTSAKACWQIASQVYIDFKMILAPSI